MRTDVRTALAAALAAFVLLPSSGQDSYYRLPMDIPVLLSANFGELRPGHLHSGVDFKTGGVEGQRLHAAAGGYISRIGIQPGGYGRVLYVTHDNGTTTVYGHMSRFRDDIEEYLRKGRYRNRRNNLDLYPQKSDFPVSKGDFIGLSGNSGSSTGPHLHFEIRDRDQSPMNLVRMGNVVPNDDVPPQIMGIHWIPVDSVDGIPLYGKPLSAKPVMKSAGSYSLSAPMRVTGCGYFAVEYTDRKSGVANSFAVYRVRETVNGQRQFELAIDRYPFADTKWVNSIMQYDMHQKSSYDVMRLVRAPHTPLPFFSTPVGGGLLRLSDGDGVVIELEDDMSNVSTLSFGVTLTDRAPSLPQEDMMPVDRNKNFTAMDHGIQVSVPAGSLFESAFIRVARIETPVILSPEVSAVSEFYTVGDVSVPILRPITVSLRCDLPQQLRRYATLARVLPGGKVAALGGTWRDGRLTASVSTFGTFCVIVDNTAPWVRNLFADGADFTGKRSFTLSYGDDMSGVSSVEATIDDRWVILEQSTTRGTITHVFDPEVTQKGQSHVLRLTLVDGRGNKREETRRFTY